MTDRDKKLLAIFAALIFLGGYWFLVLGSKRSAVASAQDAKATAQKSLDDAIAAETAGQAEKKHYPVSYSRVLRMGKAIPVDDDFASLLVQVNDIADAAKVDFVSLTNTDGAATPAAAGTTGSTGTTTCDALVSGGGGSETATAATGATGASGAVVQPAPAQSGIGKTINKAKAGEQTASNDANRAAGSNADLAARCATSPTLTDLTAVSSGLQLFTYNFIFDGSFYDLHTVFDGLLGMVNARNGHVSITGRLLQINTIDMSVKQFPTLEATVEMTGYALPVGTTISAGATSSGPAGASQPASVTRTDSTTTSDGPPQAAILGGR